MFFYIVVFSQEQKIEGLKLTFFDECTKEVIKPEFEIEVFEELNYSMINVYVKRGEWISQYSTILKTKKDTIKIPRLLFSFDQALHSSDWGYFKCNTLCEGKVVDYYENGNKRLEGFFEKGKPKEVLEYKINGKLGTRYFYDFPKLSYTRVDYFNENEELKEYELNTNKKRKTIIKVYNSDDELIRKEINKI